MNKRQAISECKKSARDMAFAFGNFLVIKFNEEYAVVTSDYIAKYNPNAKIVYICKGQIGIFRKIARYFKELYYVIRPKKEKKEEKQDK